MDTFASSNPTSPQSSAINVPVVTPPQTETSSANEKYTVVKGDYIWNITKEVLENEFGRAPTNAEILEHTRWIIEKNDKKLESDNYTVIMHPGEELIVTKQAA